MIESLGPKKQKGVLAPLFDRLVDEKPDDQEEAIPLGFISIEELKHSILREVEMLFNTRFPLKFSDPEKEEESSNTTHDTYGIPMAFGLRDLSELDGTSTTAWKNIEKTLERAIKRYEPRLITPQVTVTVYNAARQTLTVNISGMVRCGEQIERVQFPIDLASQ